MTTILNVVPVIASLIILAFIAGFHPTNEIALRNGERRSPIRPGT